LFPVTATYYAELLLPTFRPLLEYCCVVWSPHHKYLIEKLENVQRYFTKRIPGYWNIPYSERLTKLNLQTLETRREIIDLKFCYSVLHQNINTSLTTKFSYNYDGRTRGHNLKLFKQRCNIDKTKYFFTNRVVDKWNSLPEHIVNSTSITAFNKKLNTYYPL